MNYKKAFYLLLSAVALVIFWGLQPFFINFSTSTYCRDIDRTDFVEGKDGLTYAEQNTYLAIDVKGVRNFLFPFSYMTLIRNEEGKISCDGLELKQATLF
jgi:hypothetical protein